MSADNWTVCPKCYKEAIKKKEKEKQETYTAYGEVEPEEYEKLLIISRQSIKTNKTLREDYEFYINRNGLFTVSYSAHCNKCGFKYNFNYTKQFEI